MPAIPGMAAIFALSVVAAAGAAESVLAFCESAAGAAAGGAAAGGFAVVAGWRAANATTAMPATPSESTMRERTDG